MKSVLSEVLADVARQSVIDMFQSYGVTLRARMGSAPAPGFAQAATASGVIVASVVGFNGQDFRGTSMLATSFELAARARPPAVSKNVLSPNSSADWIFLRDWVGELGNQALGRIKNKMNRFGVVFDVSPPASFSGATLTFAVPKSPDAVFFTFESGDHTVWTCLDALCDPTRQVSAAPDDATLGEGKVVVFD